MKIGIYAGQIPSTTFIESLINELASRAHDVTLFGKQKSPVDYAVGHVHLARVAQNPLRIRFQGLTEYLRSRALRQQNLSFIDCARFGPVLRAPLDLLHIQWTKHLVELTPILPYLNFPVILSLRGTQTNVTPVVNPDFFKRLQACFPFVSRFHAVSEHMKQVAIGLGIPEQKIVVIHPAVEKALLAYPLEKETRSDFRFIAVGRDHWKKGIPYALDALTCLLQEGHRNWHFEIIGPGDFEAERFQVHDCGLTNHVSFSGSLNHKDTLSKIAQSDCLILPSVEEGLANVALEAMALGTRVISSDCNGMPEAISHTETGFLFPTRNVSALTECLHQVLFQSPHEALAMVQRARIRIENGFLSADQVDRFIHCYEGLL